MRKGGNKPARRWLQRFVRCFAWLQFVVNGGDFWKMMCEVAAFDGFGVVGASVKNLVEDRRLIVPCGLSVQRNAAKCLSPTT